MIPAKHAKGKSALLKLLLIEVEAKYMLPYIPSYNYIPRVIMVIASFFFNLKFRGEHL